MSEQSTVRPCKSLMWLPAVFVRRVGEFVVSEGQPWKWMAHIAGEYSLFWKLGTASGRRRRSSNNRDVFHLSCSVLFFFWQKYWKVWLKKKATKEQLIAFDAFQNPTTSMECIQIPIRNGMWRMHCLAVQKWVFTLHTVSTVWCSTKQHSYSYSLDYDGKGVLQTNRHF